MFLPAAFPLILLLRIAALLLMLNIQSVLRSLLITLLATANTGAGLTTDGAQAAGSICPKKWRLPTGEITTGEFTQLYAAYGNNKTNLDAAWSPVHVGNYDGSTLYGSDADADWWSSTSVSSTNARHLIEITNGGINPARNNTRRHGFSLRCLLGNHLQ